jgi:hypothetical protein
MFFFMQDTSKNYNFRLIIVILFLAVIPTLVFSDATGRTGRTQKTSTQGCSCHGSSASSGVIVTITGPDTVFVNQTALYTLTISGGPASGSGCDIAARTGTFSPVSSTIKLSGTELTHKANTLMTSGSVTFQFNYIYTTGPIVDTLYANGLSSNSNNSTSGDQWNWSPKKVIRVMTLTSVGDQQNYPNNFTIYQNYPNPFNPETNFKFSIRQTSNVNLKIFNSLGEQVAVLLNEQRQPGEYSVSWNGSSLPSGIYFYQFTAGDFKEVKKMVLIK